MKPVIITTVPEMLELSRQWPAGSKVGFVPTMGYLHEGHLSLVAAAEAECDIIIVSIYVNPSQFGPREDLSTYPRDFDRDYALLSRHEVDYIFLPHDKEMYPAGYKTWITLDEISTLHCGVSRPNHFRGVATIVAKLMNLVNPDLMYMGLKDYQQVVILEKMITDLHIRTRIRRCAIIREADGLAMSSRNKYLSLEERQQALCLSQSLEVARTMFQDGVSEPDIIIHRMQAMVEEAQGRVDYIAVVDPLTLLPVESVVAGIKVLMAVQIGTTRLIDNTTF